MVVTSEQLEMVRHVVHKIMVPCIFAIGVFGNILSIIVLTRKRMRCSTNVYLTGLAVSDLLYLLMFFVMSLKHYEGMNRYKMYWSLMGLFHWLIDSFSYISVYIIVSFTIERYIAVCHPIRGQSLCTEARAKKVIAIVVVIVMLSILTTAFEYELVREKHLVDKKTNKPCTINTTTVKPTFHVSSTTQFHDPFYVPNRTASRKFHHDLPKSHQKRDKDKDALMEVLKNQQASFIGQKFNISDPNTTMRGVQCELVDFYRYTNSAFSSSPSYTAFYIGTSIIYAGIPLLILVTFNTFLIMAVRKSNKLRKNMTNNVNSRQIKQKLSSMTQENKITITLIAVVMLFVICQLPWACISIADNFTNLEDNLSKLMSNIANLLVLVNAASNFFLYCLLSDKYRKTVKELLTGHDYRRQDTLSSSMFSRQTTLASSWKKDNVNDTIRLPRKTSQQVNRSFSTKTLQNSSESELHSSKICNSEDQSKSLSPVLEKCINTSNLNGNKNNSYYNRRKQSLMQGTDKGSLHDLEVHSPPKFKKVEDNGGENSYSGEKSLKYRKKLLTFIESLGTKNDRCARSLAPNSSRNRPSSFGVFDCQKKSHMCQRKQSLFVGTPIESSFTASKQFLNSSGSSQCLNRSYSLDRLPKIRHSPHCRDFPYNF